MSYVNNNHFSTNDQLGLIQRAIKLNKLETLKEPVLKFNVISKNINPENLEETSLQDILNVPVTSLNSNF